MKGRGLFPRNHPEVVTDQPCQDWEMHADESCWKFGTDALV